MKTDIERKSNAMESLRHHLGFVESERFLSLVLRESFDYAPWRQEQWEDSDVADLAAKVRKLRQGSNQELRTRNVFSSN